MKDVRTKLQEALELMVIEGAKISPYSVERRANVSNGSVKYHEDIERAVILARKTTNWETQNKAESTVGKKKYNSLKVKYKQADKKRDCYFKALKSAEKKEGVLADAIANLTWQLHRERSNESLSDHVVRVVKNKR